MIWKTLNAYKEGSKNRIEIVISIQHDGVNVLGRSIIAAYHNGSAADDRIAQT